MMNLLFGTPFTVSTHSRPKAAGRPEYVFGCSGAVSTHSRPKAAGPSSASPLRRAAFQLTAARRRLARAARKWK